MPHPTPMHTIRTLHLDCEHGQPASISWRSCKQTSISLSEMQFSEYNAEINRQEVKQLYWRRFMEYTYRTSFTPQQDTLFFKTTVVLSSRGKFCFTDPQAKRGTRPIRASARVPSLTLPILLDISAETHQYIRDCCGNVGQSGESYSG